MSRSIDLLLQSSTRSWCYSFWFPFWQCFRRTCIWKVPHVFDFRSMIQLLLRQPGLLNVLNAISNVRNKVKLALGREPKDFLVLKYSSWLLEWVHAPGQKRSVRVSFFELWILRMLSNAVFSWKHIQTHTHNSLFMKLYRINHTIHQKRCPSLKRNHEKD